MEWRKYSCDASLICPSDLNSHDNSSHTRRIAFVCAFELQIIIKGKIVRSDFDAIALQADLDKVNEWIDRWQMQLNMNKYKLLPLGSSNPQNKYGK